MPPRFCRALLTVASRVAPARDRDAWRLRWDSGLASLWTLIERGELAFDGRAQLVRFCLAAFASAFWLRFSREGLRRWTRAPSFPLAAAFGAFALGAALTRGYWRTRYLVGLARHWTPMPTRPHGYDYRADTLFAYGFPIVLAATTALILIAIGARMLHRGGWRYWSFFALKTMLLTVLSSLAWIDGGAALRAMIPHEGIRILGGGLLLGFAFVGFSGWCALWSLADQRRRCPVCLRRLEMPVTLGSWSSVFDPAITEFLCSEGHGSLSLLEAESEADRWVGLDSSWRSLFQGKSRKKKDTILR